MRSNSIAVLFVAALIAGHVVVHTSELSAQSRALSTATDAARPDTRALWRDPGDVTATVHIGA